MESRPKCPCCVPGCKDRVNKRHRFPKYNEKLMKVWIENIAHPRFIQLTSQQIYGTYYVCDKHFSQKYIVPGTKRGLRRDAIPTMFLSGFGDDQHEHTSGENAETVHYPEVGQEEQAEQIKWVDQAQHEKMIVSLVAQQRNLCCENGLSTSYASAASVKQPSTSYISEASVEQSACSTSKASIKSPSTSSFVETAAGVSTPPKRRRGILRTINVTRQKYLTPKCKILYKKLMECSRKSTKLGIKSNSFRKRLFEAEKVGRSSNFQGLLQDVNETTYNFMMQQIRNQKLAPKGRRFTVEDKIFALTLLKSSGKGYRLLSKVFALPSVRTLQILLQKINFKPGINSQIFQNMKTQVDKIKKKDKCCALIFDEMAITSSLNYNKRIHIVEGFEDCGYKQTAKIADHANLFMLKGISRQWKQPVVFSFSNGPVKSSELKKMIVEIISECQKIGLDVVATICDQGSTNQAAINGLMKESAQKSKRANAVNRYFIVNNSEVVPLFDVPHLFKGIRNNLLTKWLQFRQDNKLKVCRWEHVEQFYMLDASDSVRMCPKLTDSHIFVKKINKMKVSLCTQVFSYSVGTLMKRISQWGIPNLGQEVGDTADFILFLDRLFDSLNANRKVAPASKSLKRGVTKTSQHDSFWRESINIIESAKFFDEKKKKLVVVPSLSNLKKTLERFIYLKDMLLDKKGLSYVLTRSLNQDPVENFFSCVRSQGGCNRNPNVPQFVSSLKSLIVNNFFSRRSLGSNCEEDDHNGALDDLKNLLTSEEIPGVSSFEDIPENTFTLPTNISRTKRTRIESCTINYVAGYILKQCFRKTGQCSECSHLLSYTDNPEHLDFIEAKEYEHSSLKRPGSCLVFVTTQALSRLFYILPRVCAHTNILKKIVAHISS